MSPTTARKHPPLLRATLSMALLLLASSLAFAVGDADVAVTKSNDTGGSLIAGGTVTYTINLHNFGPNGATQIHITDILDGHLINITPSATVPDDCTVVGQQVDCDIQGIGNNGDDTITITAQVDPSTPADTIITNCATITNANQNDPDLTNNTGCDGDGFTVIECPVDLTITKTATDLSCLASIGKPVCVGNPISTIQGGSDFFYHIDVANNGTGTGNNVTVTDDLPSGVAYVSDTGSCTGGTPGDLGPVLTCNVGTLASGASTSFDIRVTAVNSGSIENTATVTSDENCDKNSQDNTSTSTIESQTNNVPVGLEADREGCGTDSDCPTLVSDINRVFEPNETARVDPAWKNTLDNDDPDITGTASALTGPGDGVTATYNIDDSTADYGPIPAGATADCNAATNDCYAFTITQTGGTRPNNGEHPRHWDATFHEALSSSETFDWQLHLGDSFPDVPRSNIFYRYVETIFHNHITIGCQGGNIFCPGDHATRQEMAAFISRSILLKDVNIPIVTADYDCANALTPVAGQFVDVPATNGFCKHANYLKTVNVTLGCFDSTHFCPLNEVLRSDMAVFIARAYVFKATSTSTPDADIPQWKQSADLSRQYNCTGSDQIDPDTLNTIPANTAPFLDVPTSAPFCKHVGFLFVTTIQGDSTKFIIDGDGAGHFLPNTLIRRDETAKILANAFGDLPLYGPLVF